MKGRTVRIKSYATINKGPMRFGKYVEEIFIKKCNECGRTIKSNEGILCKYCIKIIYRVYKKFIRKCPYHWN